MKRFDLIVVGAGSGLEVSAAAAGRGLSVAVVEQGPFGGTCLNRGCIPSKMLIHCADVAETVRRAHLFGVPSRVERVDWAHVIRRAFAEVDADAAKIEEGNRRHEHITVFKGTGRFVGHKELEVEGERLGADTIVIASGTRPSVPEIEGMKDVPCLTSDEALQLPEQPRRLIVVGGGFVAAELAHFFGGLGTEVTVVHRRHVLLREEDDAVARRFTEAFGRKHRLVLNATVARGRRDGDGVALEVQREGGRTEAIAADAVLFATGRVPNSDVLDVARSGVATDERGYVKVDEYLETNVPGIWALGDVVGRYLLKHSANLEASHAAWNIFNPEQKAPVDYHAMPHAVFSSPQVASVGLTERAAQAQRLPYAAATYAYADTAYGSSIEERDGFVKVLAHRETRQILGCHVVGAEASILVQEAVNAMRARLPIEVITQSIYVHPALPEVVQRAFGALEL